MESGSVTIDICSDPNYDYRSEMEDYFLKKEIMKGIYLFAVLDGHGGKSCAKYFTKIIPKALAEKIKNIDTKCIQKIKDAINKTFLEEDEIWYNSNKKVISGTTFSGVLILEDLGKIVTINLGDSKTLLIEDEDYHPTYDHKPSNSEERDRIEYAGGYVSMGRIDDILAVSRSFGDNEFKGYRSYEGKNAKVSPLPDLTVYHSLNYKILIASDGLFDVVDDYKAVKYIRDGSDAEFFVYKALYKGSTDNISVMIIDIKK